MAGASKYTNRDTDRGHFLFFFFLLFTVCSKYLRLLLLQPYPPAGIYPPLSDRGYSSRRRSRGRTRAADIHSRARPVYIDRDPNWRPTAATMTAEKSPRHNRLMVSDKAIAIYTLRRQKEREKSCKYVLYYIIVFIYKCTY